MSPSQQQQITLTQETKVTLRFAVFVFTTVIALTGGWYTLKNDTQTVKDQVQAVKEQLVDQHNENKDLKQNFASLTEERAEMKKDIALLNQQVAQLKELTLIVINNTNGAAGSGTVIVAPQKPGRK